MSHVPAIIAPSLLSCDFARLGEESNRMLDCGADWLHVDIMDGHFVPNITLGAPIVTSLRRATKGFLDCHMMVSQPRQWVKDFAKAGADSYTFHIESDDRDPRTLIDEIHSAGMKASIALKPGTDISAVMPFVDAVDMVLVMTVEPGFGGQQYNPHQLSKIHAVRERCPGLHIQVDGGISVDTCGECCDAGANVLVAGSAVFNAQDPKRVIEQLRERVLTAQSNQQQPGKL